LCDESEIVAGDVSLPLVETVRGPLVTAPEDRLPQIVERELLRSVGNVPSVLFTPLVNYARDAGAAVREGSLDGIKDFTKKATLAVAIGSSAYVLSV